VVPASKRSLRSIRSVSRRHVPATVLQAEEALDKAAAVAHHWPWPLRVGEAHERSLVLNLERSAERAN